VDPEKKHIDLSRKRVNKRERIDKIFMFKRERKAESFLRVTAEKLHKPVEEIFEKAASPMEEAHGDVYTALEESSRQGVEVLTKINIPADIAQALAQIAQERIHPPIVEVKGELHLTSTKPDGVNQIKKALQAAQKSSAVKTTKIHIYTIAAPKYSLKVEAENYKEAENTIQKASEAAIKAITKAGGEGSLRRD
jgi:translation initiation factor 2 subunit 1